MVAPVWETVWTGWEPRQHGIGHVGTKPESGFRQQGRGERGEGCPGGRTRINATMGQSRQDLGSPTVATHPWAQGTALGRGRGVWVVINCSRGIQRGRNLPVWIERSPKIRTARDMPTDGKCGGWAERTAPVWETMRAGRELCQHGIGGRKPKAQGFRRRGRGDRVAQVEGHGSTQPRGNRDKDLESPTVATHPWAQGTALGRGISKWKPPRGSIGEIGACNEAARREVIAPSPAKRVVSHGCYVF